MTSKPYQAVIPTLLLSAGIGFCPPANAENLGSVSDSQILQIAAGESQALYSQAAAGTYLRLRLHSETQPIDLTLVDADGTPLRQLLDNALGAPQVHVIVQDGDYFMIRNEGSEATQITWGIERSVSPEEMSGPAPSFLSPTLTRLNDQIAEGGGTEAFWADRARDGTPMIEPSSRDGYVIATFLWRGAQHNVRLWGGPTYDHTWLTRLGQSDVWYASFEMPVTARLSYGFAPDVPQFEGSARENRVALLATLQADPLNKYPVFSQAPDRFAQRSMVEGSKAPVQPGLSEVTDPNAPAGALRSSVLTTPDGENRRVDYYTPAHFDPDRTDTVLLVLFDGPSYQTDRAPIPRMLDRLIAEGRLPQVVVALIDPVDGDQRGVDLTCNPEFADLLAGDWMSQIEAALGIAPDAAQRVLAGSSYGGLATAYIAHRHPDVFGNGIVLSGSFWWAPEGYDGQGRPYMSQLWMDKAPEVRLWMSAGLYETGRTPGTVSILETTRHLRDILTLQGKDVTYREYAGGHDYLVWRGALTEGLLDLFGQ